MYHETFHILQLTRTRHSFAASALDINNTVMFQKKNTPWSTLKWSADVIRDWSLGNRGLLAVVSFSNADDEEHLNNMDTTVTS